ncbi:type III-B CRISPR module-associated protein Cmr5 [Thiomicrospira sp. R3]|uniref:type III-B CRISPR module-associated protein Cmr5 n=1 Tax=Thiomicrospira sp. R3 TaxID=3035472 RepID=UPI00259BE836|nr:type III-B CRISPR module-associated protein Cmr5 [Thiomicrospira sp. R3]WFE68508.1 type III-B CRISPR module-associated protein Cmr5 [Thiomicrospira sp. R3]
MSNLQTQEQQRAQCALNWIKQQTQKTETVQKEIKSWSSQFPIMIHTNGFGPACAFFKSRQNVEGARELYKHLNAWLVKALPSLVNNADLMDVVSRCDQQQYRLMQAEAQAYLQWVKQLAKAYLKGDETNNGGGA